MDEARHTAAMRLLSHLWEGMHWPGKWRQNLRSMGDLVIRRTMVSDGCCWGNSVFWRKKRKGWVRVINQQLKANHKNQRVTLTDYNGISSPIAGR